MLTSHGRVEEGEGAVGRAGRTSLPELSCGRVSSTTFFLFVSLVTVVNWRCCKLAAWWQGGATQLGRWPKTGEEAYDIEAGPAGRVDGHFWQSSAWWDA